MSQSALVVPRRQGLVVAVMCLAVILVIANVASLNVAVPAIGAGLGADQAEIQWIVDSYALVLAAFLFPAGALGDRYSRKLMLLAGLVVMVGASIWSARAGGAAELIAARAVTGLGAAFVFPGTLSTITAVSAPDKRGRAVALWAACTSIGGIIGIIASGALLEHHPWPSVFWGTAAFGGACLFLVLVVVPDTSDPAEANLDPLGAVLSISGVGGLVLAITEGPVRGWTDSLTLGGVVAGIAGLAGFVGWELRARRPLLDVRLFRDPGFATGSLAVFLVFAAAFGSFFMCVQFVAYIFGYGPLDSGLALVPVGLTMLPASLAGPVLARRIGVFWTEAIGMAVCSAGFVALSRLGVDATFAGFTAAFLVFGLGIGLCMAPATEAIVAALPRAKQGVASAVNDTARELGGALGIAVIGSAFNLAYRAAVDDTSSVPAGLVDVVRDSPASGLVAAAGDLTVSRAVQSAFVDGWKVALLVAASLVGVGAVACAAVGRRVAVARISPSPAVAPAGIGLAEHRRVAIGSRPAVFGAGDDPCPTRPTPGPFAPPREFALHAAVTAEELHALLDEAGRLDHG